MTQPTTDNPDTLRTFADPDLLRRHLPAPRSWRPVPTVTDRSFWDGVDPATRQAILDRAEKLRSEPWPVLLASLWRDFVETGNRTRYETANFARRQRTVASTLAACLTDDRAWHDDVLDGVWLILEETSWCIPAHDFSRDPDSARLPDPGRPCLDLFAAETGALLAWVAYVLGDRLDTLSSLVTRRIANEVRSRILVPQRTIDTWVWFGRRGPVNNWNPWINSNVLACSFLLDDDHQEMVTTAARALEGLDVFLSGYADDGGCDEGQAYWWRAGASLSECLEYLRDASGGALDGFGIPKVREIARYPHRVHIADDWYVNVGDGPAKAESRNTVESYVLYRFGQRVGDDEVMVHAQAMRGDGPVTTPRLSLARSLFALADAEWSRTPPAAAPLVEQAWWSETELVTARQRAGSAEGLFCSIKGGHNGESHNHNDIGTVLVALDGHPAVVDPGVASYSRQTFGPRRYELWTMRSLYHNLPSVDGCEQAPGSSYAARDMRAELGSDRVAVGLDLAGAYPDEAGIVRWQRDLTLDRPAGLITLADTWELDHDPRSVVLHLMTSAEPRREQPGLVQVPTPTRPLAIRYDPDVLEPADAETIALDDPRLESVWGDALWRLTLGARVPERHGTWTLEFVAG